MNRTVVGFIAGAFAGFAMPYFIQKPLNLYQLSILFAVSAAVLLHHEFINRRIERQKVEAPEPTPRIWP